jgi:hypothetical protein
MSAKSAFVSGFSRYLRTSQFEFAFRNFDVHCVALAPVHRYGGDKQSPLHNTRCVVLANRGNQPLDFVKGINEYKSTDKFEQIAHTLYDAVYRQLYVELNADKFIASILYETIEHVPHFHVTFIPHVQGISSNIHRSLSGRDDINIRHVPINDFHKTYIANDVTSLRVILDRETQSTRLSSVVPDVYTMCRTQIPDIMWLQTQLASFQLVPMVDATVAAAAPVPVPVPQQDKAGFISQMSDWLRNNVKLNDANRHVNLNSHDVAAVTVIPMTRKNASFEIVLGCEVSGYYPGKLNFINGKNESKSSDKYERMAETLYDETYEELFIKLNFEPFIDSLISVTASSCSKSKCNLIFVYKMLDICCESYTQILDTRKQQRKDSKYLEMSRIEYVKIESIDTAHNVSSFVKGTKRHLDNVVLNYDGSAVAVKFDMHV